jgi:hypothetical protein
LSSSLELGKDSAERPEKPGKTGTPVSLSSDPLTDKGRQHHFHSCPLFLLPSILANIWLKRVIPTFKIFNRKISPRKPEASTESESNLNFKITNGYKFVIYFMSKACNRRQDPLKTSCLSKAT